MSRVDKQLRRKHRKDKKQNHSRIMRDWMSPEDVEMPANVLAVSYEITSEPLEVATEKTPGLAEALDGIRDQLFEDISSSPEAAIPVLERLLDQFPNAPMLLNWLAAALEGAGKTDESERVARLNFEANPHYLFARLDYAQNRLRKGDLDAVEKILDRKFDLKLMYPDREIFHLSEYRAFCALMIPFFIRKGEFRGALVLFDTLERLEPDGEVTRSLRPAVQGSFLLEAARKLVGMWPRDARLPGRISP